MLKKQVLLLGTVVLVMLVGVYVFNQLIYPIKCARPDWKKCDNHTEQKEEKRSQTIEEICAKKANKKEKKGTVQHNIQKSLRDFCKSSDFQRFGLMENHLLYSENAALMYCEVPKVACTSWKKVLHLLNGKVKSLNDFKDREIVHTINIPRMKKIVRTDWRLNHYYTFMFIRHPFERILSAYRNKFVDPYTPLYQEQIGSVILRKYREGLTEQQYKSGQNVTFPEFVRFIIDVHEDKGYKGLDPHWQLIMVLCNPCRIKFNFIGKMETLQEDAGVILENIGYDMSSFPTGQLDKYKKDVTDLMSEYFNQISSESMNKLYKIYQPDLMAFNFSRWTL